MQAVAIQDTRYKAPHVLQLNGCKPPPPFATNQPKHPPVCIWLGMAIKPRVGGDVYWGLPTMKLEYDRELGRELEHLLVSCHTESAQPHTSLVGTLC